MSIKRSKQRSSGGSRSSSEDLPSFLVKPVEKDKTWEEWTTGQPDEAFAPYSLKTRYAKGSLILHPKFGRGVVAAVEGDARGGAVSRRAEEARPCRDLRDEPAAGAVGGGAALGLRRSAGGVAARLRSCPGCAAPTEAWRS